MDGANQVPNSACICSVLSAVYRIRQFDSADYTWDSIGPFALGYAPPPPPTPNPFPSAASMH